MPDRAARFLDAPVTREGAPFDAAVLLHRRAIVGLDIFPQLQPLADGWQAIRDEAEALALDDCDPWVDPGGYTGTLLGFALYAAGERRERACAHCPQTAAIVEPIPGLHAAFFSLLGPGSEICPHEDRVGSVWRAHLGLVTTENCALIVGHQRRSWVPGEVFVFDYTLPHQAWNRGNSWRKVLIVDVLRD